MTKLTIIVLTTGDVATVAVTQWDDTVLYGLLTEVSLGRWEGYNSSVPGWRAGTSLTITVEAKSSDGAADSTSASFSISP